MTEISVILYRVSKEIIVITSLSSIKSQPKIVVVVVVFVVIIIVGQKKLTLKLGQNWVNNGYIVIVISLF